MKKSITLFAAFFSAVTLASAALAADDMAGMKTSSDAMSAPKPDSAALTDAVVDDVDPSTGMVTLEHGELKNIGMSAMTMAYKAGDASILKQAKKGEHVKIRVENVDGTYTIVKMLKR